jgi:hypothetical protein
MLFPMNAKVSKAKVYFLWDGSATGAISDLGLRIWDFVFSEYFLCF